MASASIAQAAEIQFIEDFVLAEDRAKILGQLIPGTEDYYYYNALHYQNLEQYDKVEELLKRYIKQHKYTDRVREIQHRQALLTYSRNPNRSMEFIRRSLGLQFNHQRESPDALKSLPVVLDASLISRDALAKRAFRDALNLKKFRASANDWLIDAELTADQRRDLLSRLQRPDYDNLVDLVIRDLNHKGSRGFGSLPIHSKLLLTQLEKCIQKKPGLLNDRDLVHAYLRKLLPSADVDFANDSEEHQALLERQWKFVSRLAPSHNSLKAHVLYHRLKFDQEQGKYNKQRFMEYLRLPRQTPYLAREWGQSDEFRRHPANLADDFQEYTRYAAVGSDEPLVRDYLRHFFVKETKVKPYAAYIDTKYLEQLFAETKLVEGLGDAERWYALMSPDQLQALRDRIDLEFAETNKKSFQVDEPVELELDVKNVQKLIVKIYHINTLNYFRQYGQDVNTDIQLDGLIANEEQTFQYDIAELRRVRRRFTFPQLAKAGVYVIDFIGNGRSSRAVVRKGQLRAIQRTVSRGHLFTIVDSKNQPVAAATLWLDGHEYTANEDGELVVPFTNAPGQRAVVLTKGDLSSVDKFLHEAERYEYKAGIYVDRESLVKHQKAKVLVRHGLFLNGTPIATKPLKQVKLVIQSTDLDGITSRQEVEDFKVWEDRETEYRFQVPPRLAKIKFTVSAKLDVASQNKEMSVSASQSYTLNEIDRTERIEDLHLAQTDGNYFVELLGKSGETRIGRPVKMEIRHRDFTDSVHATLQTDESSRISLGALEDIVSVTATGPEGTSVTWHLLSDAHSQYSNVHAVAGQVVMIPTMLQPGGRDSKQVSLLELRGGEFATDVTHKASIKEGYVAIEDLSPGDYSLYVRPNRDRVRIRVAEGEKRQRHVFGKTRHLELRKEKPLQIVEVDLDQQTARIQLAGVGPFARVHVFSTRFYPQHNAWEHFRRIADREPQKRSIRSRRSLYVSGRQLGEEEQYILDRGEGRHFPGNMLERPGMLLDPWDIRSTSTDQQIAAGGGSFGGSDDEAADVAAAPESRQQAAAPKLGWASFDFLGNASSLLVNLVPNEDSFVEIPLTALAGSRQIQVVAVDPVSTAYRLVSLPESDRAYADLRLVDGLEPTKHYTRQKNLKLLSKGDRFEIADIGSARFASYDRLDSIYDFMLAQNNNQTLAEFEFVMRWPEMGAEEKRELYSKYACHELNFYLSKKDPEFFRDVVKPYIAHKFHKTFLDRWLLAEDLSAYLQPWNYGQLNVVERILLGQSMSSEREATAIHVGDLFELLPHDTRRESRLFESLMLGKSLSKTESVLLGVDRPVAMDGTRAARKSTGYGIQSLERASGRVDRLRMPAVAEQNRMGIESKLSISRREGAVEEELQLNESLGQLSDDLAQSYFDDGIASGNEIAFGGRFYRKLEATKEWVENNYYRRPIEQQDSKLIALNAFWNDYAQHQGGAFFSTKWGEATSNFTECMLALAVMDLPLKSQPHDFEFDEEKLKMKAAGPLFLLDEQVREVENAADPSPILVKQNLYRRDDRYRHVRGEQQEKFITDEFTVHVVYGCNVVVSNTSSAKQKLDILLQIPVGAIPVTGAKYTNTLQIELAPYQSRSLDYEFYFPTAGDFEHFPVHVARDEVLLGYAEPVTLRVVSEPTVIDKTSWQYISQNGSEAEVLEFLKENNPQRLALEKIAFRMHDKSFAKRVYEVLDRRHVYNDTLWSYGIKHRLDKVSGEYLKHVGYFINRCGEYLESDLLTIDPVERRSYQHMEYKPLVNARAHRLGRRRQILNDRLHSQYHRLLKVLSYRAKLDHGDRMSMTYYLLLQDRVEEALHQFDQINQNALESRLQYDYLAAYLDCFHDDPMLAKSISEKYANYPVDKWRKAFASVSALVDEVNGGQPTLIDPHDRLQSQTALAAKEPSFEFEIESGKIQLTHQNLDRVTVNFYQVDLELLFSRNPFVRSVSGQFSHIRPNDSQVVELDNAALTTIDLPESLQNKNVMVEVVGGGKRRSLAHYANSMDVQIAENYGQLLVTAGESRVALPRTYVKVYGRQQNGQVQFYKDGYTDLRGRFDYTSLNTSDLDHIERFSLLVLSEENGAVVKEVSPPAR